MDQLNQQAARRASGSSTYYIPGQKRVVVQRKQKKAKTSGMGQHILIRSSVPTLPPTYPPTSGFATRRVSNLAPLNITTHRTTK